MEELINVLKKGHDSALQLDTLMQLEGDNALLVQEIVCSLSKAIRSLEKAPSAQDKKRKVHTAKQGGDKRWYIYISDLYCSFPPIYYLICMLYLILF